MANRSRSIGLPDTVALTGWPAIAVSEPGATPEGRLEHPAPNACAGVVTPLGLPAGTGTPDDGAAAAELGAGVGPAGAAVGAGGLGAAAPQPASTLLPADTTSIPATSHLRLP
jgi:hypothetical protein